MTGTRPTVWIPPGGLRELIRPPPDWKNRLSATLAKYAAPASQWSDPYGKSAREELDSRIECLPAEARWASRQVRAQLDSLSEQIAQFEQRLKALVEITPEMQLLLSLPGVGVILAATIALEVGEIARFASAARLASYAGTTPRLHASGDRVVRASTRHRTWGEPVSRGGADSRGKTPS